MGILRDAALAGAFSGAFRGGLLGAAKGVVDLAEVRGVMPRHYDSQGHNMYAPGGVIPPSTYPRAAADQGLVGVLGGAVVGGIGGYEAERRKAKQRFRPTKAEKRARRDAAHTK